MGFEVPFIGLLVSLLFIGLTGPLAALIARLMPVPPEKVTVVAEPKFLDDNFLQTPALAVDRLRLEIDHLGIWVRRAFDDLRPPRAGAPLARTKRPALCADSTSTSRAFGLPSCCAKVN